MSEQASHRVRFFKGQFLRTNDFVEEQAYHLTMRRRHNIAHHQWGIVAGLELALDEDGLPYVKPGMAIDGYGRELILTEGRPLPIKDSFDREESDTLDVWLLYNESSGQRAPLGYTSCQPETADTFYRWQEDPRLWLENPQEPVDRRRPPQLNSEQLAFAPQFPPPSADSTWSVFLGQVTRDRSQSPTTYSVSGDSRPYVGAIAQTITAPSDQTKLQLGATESDQEVRFQVASAEDNPYLTLRVDENNEKTWTLEGKTAVADTLTIDKGALTFEAGTVKAVPWGMLRFDDSLRLALPAGGGQNRMVFGTWSSDDEAFKPILTMGDNGHIIVHGDLHVQGKIKADEPIAAPFSVAAEAQLKAMYAGSLGRSHFALSGLNSPLSQFGVMYSAMPQAVVQNLENPVFLNQFVDGLKNNPSMANFVHGIFVQNADPFFQTLELGRPLNRDVITLTQPFNNDTPYGKHEGADYAAVDDCGQQDESFYQEEVDKCMVDVLCMYEGTVSEVYVGESYGVTVRVKCEHQETGTPFYIRYCHLVGKKADDNMVEGPFVSVGEVLQRGDPIGKMGSTGNSTAPHVHINLEVPDKVPKGNYVIDHVVDPHPYVLRGNKGQVQYI